MSAVPAVVLEREPVGQPTGKASAVGAREDRVGVAPIQQRLPVQRRGRCLWDAKQRGAQLDGDRSGSQNCGGIASGHDSASSNHGHVGRLADLLKERQQRAVVAGVIGEGCRSDR